MAMNYLGDPVSWEFLIREYSWHWHVSLDIPEHAETMCLKMPWGTMIKYFWMRCTYSIHPNIMVPIGDWLFPIIFLCGPLIVLILVYHSSMRRSSHDLETSSTQMSSLTQLNEGILCFFICQSMTILKQLEFADDIPLPTYPPRAYHELLSAGDSRMGLF